MKTEKYWRIWMIIGGLSIFSRRVKKILWNMEVRSAFLCFMWRFIELCCAAISPDSLQYLLWLTYVHVSFICVVWCVPCLVFNRFLFCTARLWFHLTSLFTRGVSAVSIRSLLNSYVAPYLARTARIICIRLEQSLWSMSVTFYFSLTCIFECLSSDSSKQVCFM